SNAEQARQTVREWVCNEYAFDDFLIRSGPLAASASAGGANRLARSPPNQSVRAGRITRLDDRATAHRRRSAASLFSGPLPPPHSGPASAPGSRNAGILATVRRFRLVRARRNLAANR